MPGFLAASGYGGTTRIDLGNGYWCEVKNCLTSAEKGYADALMGLRQRLDVNAQRQYADMDIAGYQQEMVLQSVVAWNIDDEDGSIWPLLPEAPPPGKPYPEGSLRRLSVARLPAPVFAQIYQEVNELNSPRKGEEAASFPAVAVSGDQDGGSGAAGAAEVPGGEGVVEAAREPEPAAF